MKIGLLGLPKSGKTTLFNALTKSNAQINTFASKPEPNIAVVEVGDERVTKLSEMYKPKKTVHATLECIDVVGLSEGGAKKEDTWGELLRVIRNADALALVLRNFDSDLEGKPDPMRDLDRTEQEFLISDLMIVEKRIEKIALSNKKGLGTPALKTEEKALQRILVQLNENLPIRQLNFDKDEELAIRGYQFLTQKPVLAIVNSSEDNFNKSAAVLEQIAKKCKVVEVAGSFEMELARLSAEESATFMEDMGIKESARDRLTTLAYETLGYISFFTVGEDEVRAWNIRKGQTAVEAAGVIHSDLARGFIAAECFTYSDLMQLGSEKLIKEKGKFKLEGKEYFVKDGDILSIRFNV